jgi:hypothetical protein
MEGRLAASPAILAPIFLGFTFHREVSQSCSSLSASQATAQTLASGVLLGGDGGGSPPEPSNLWDARRWRRAEGGTNSSAAPALNLPAAVRRNR